MRVAIDARYVDGKGSGIGTYTLNLAKALLVEDKNIELVMIFSNRNAFALLEHDRVTKIVFPFSANSLSTRFLLGRFIRNHDFDLFHSPFAVAPMNLEKPLVVTVHDLMWVVNPRFITKSYLNRLVSGIFFRRSLHSVLSKATRILTVSKNTRQDIIAYMPSCGAKTAVSYNGIDNSTIYPMKTQDALAAIAEIVPAKTPFVLTVGNNSPHKNHINAIKGFMEAFLDCPDYRMVLVHRFSRRDVQMRKLMLDQQVRKKVIFLPHVTKETLNALYNAARIYLHPSYYEGFGIPLLEAMAVGTPVVTSRASCMPEVAGSAALFVEPDDYRTIVTALRQLEKDDDLRAKLIHNGKKRVGDFSWNSCAKTTLQVYREILTGTASVENTQQADDGC